MAKRGIDMMCKCKAVAMIVLGLLLIGNAYWNFLNWATFIGAAIALAGVVKLFIKHEHPMMM